MQPRPSLNCLSHFSLPPSLLSLPPRYDKLSLIDADKVATYVSSLQRPDGSFTGDSWGEVDTRFTYCAVSGLGSLGLRGEYICIYYYC